MRPNCKYHGVQCFKPLCGGEKASVGWAGMGSDMKPCLACAMFFMNRLYTYTFPGVYSDTFTVMPLCSTMKIWAKIKSWEPKKGPRGQFLESWYFPVGFLWWYEGLGLRTHTGFHVISHCK